MDQPSYNPAPVYTVGTLRYNKQQLVILFFWLMWNDFSITIIERIGGLNSILMKNEGATFTQMALLGSIGGFLNPWINPWVSTWSDRLRSRHGRRRPFLLIATPFFAFFLMIIPYMPGFYHFLLHFPFFVGVAKHLPMSGEALFIGICGIISGLFNAVVLAIFQYLYWDVVPGSLMGRFNSMSKTVTILAALVWSFWIIGIADTHVKWVYVGTGAFCLAIYMLSVWQIKEGEYPPPDPHTKGGVVAPIRAYFVECFSQPYFLWVFFASFLYQLGNQGGGYSGFYLYYDLNLHFKLQGMAGGWSSLISAGFGMLFGFYFGSLTDRLKPVRLIGRCLMAVAALKVMWFFYIHDYHTLLVASCVEGVVMFVFGVVVGAFQVQIFPREKIGQFCSAQAVFYQFAMVFLGPLIAMLFDHIKFNRLGYLWTATFYFLAALVYVKVYHNWKRRHGHTPVPHAG